MEITIEGWTIVYVRNLSDNMAAVRHEGTGAIHLTQRDADNDLAQSLEHCELTATNPEDYAVVPVKVTYTIGGI